MAMNPLPLQRKTLFLILAIAVSSCSPVPIPRASTPSLPSSAPPTPSPRSSPTLDPRLIESANEAIGQGDPAKAASLAQSILDIDASNEEALFVLSSAQYMTGDYAQSVRTLSSIDTAAIEDNLVLEQLLDAFVTISRATFDQEIIGQALVGAQPIADRLAARTSNPADLSLAAVLLVSSPNYANEVSVSDSSLAHFQAAEEAYSTGDYEAAAGQYQAALEDEPRFQLAQIYYADSLFAMGDYPAAESSLSSALQSDPTLIQAWDFLGHTHEKMGLWRHARISYLSALMLNPDDDFARSGIARLSEAYSSWSSASLAPYEKSLLLPPSLESEPVELGNLGPASSHQGGFIFRAPDASVLITMNWQPAPGSAVAEVVPQLLEGAVSALPGATQQSEVRSFEYSPFPIWYVEFLYAPPDEPNPNATFVASWACEGVLFNLQLAIPGDDFAPLQIARNQILDPILCPAV